jgi:hypothetical protein
MRDVDDIRRARPAAAHNGCGHVMDRAGALKVPAL